MHRFFVDHAVDVDHWIHFDARQSHHICRVLRLRPGTQVIVFDGQGWGGRVRLLEIDPVMSAGVMEVLLKEEPVGPVNVILAQSLAKGDRMELVLQKAVELGVEAFQPFVSLHAVVSLSAERAEKKQQRWQSIAVEACKQCRRNRVPPVAATIDYLDLLKQIGSQPAILLYEQEHIQNLKQVLLAQKEAWSDQTIYLLVGPEGGWAKEEVEQARSQGLSVVGLGPRILRTETAGLAALAAIMYEFDAWEG